MNQVQLIESLPAYLRRFVCEQDYSRYTAEDHEVWRFILQQLQVVLRSAAHPVYFEGLEKTGISLDRVPSIDDMNACLAKIGWAAVIVDGFIPPAVFMEFQARKILPIAIDMRAINQVLYTPAPDIVHETAGHAPFIVDPEYAEFLQRFGEVGMKAISTREDHEVYLAVRNLSIVKGSPQATEQTIQLAQQRLDTALAAADNCSEVVLLSRLHWWTVEYGLVGDVDNYRIYGAGLLSSLGESISCQDDEAVKKLPLSIDAVHASYDITRPQPQLFVAKNCSHLMEVLESFASSMAWKIGGAVGLQRAIDSRVVCTAQYNSGLEVSGVLTRMLVDESGSPVYIGTTGPTQLAFKSTQLANHGTAQHAEGFGSPVGNLKGLSDCISGYSLEQLRDIGVVKGRQLHLEFASGVVVDGRLDQIFRCGMRNLLLNFSACRVTGPKGEVLFDPAWGNYDMAVGQSVTSVWGGAADRENFDLFDNPAKDSPIQNWSDSERSLFSIYERIRALRESGTASDADLRRVFVALEDFPKAWLPRLFLHELAQGDLASILQSDLLRLAQALDSDADRLIHMGLSMPKTSSQHVRPVQTTQTA